MGWAPVLFLPAPIDKSALSFSLAANRSVPRFPLPFRRRSPYPHYPAKSPLDDVLRLAAPGTDEYVTEGYAAEIMMLLEEWSRHLKADPPAIGSYEQVR